MDHVGETVTSALQQRLILMTSRRWPRMPVKKIRLAANPLSVRTYSKIPSPIWQGLVTVERRVAKL